MVNPRVLAIATMAVTKLSGINVDDVEKFLAGTIYGLIQVDDLTKIQTCLKDAQNLGNEIQEAVADFEKGDVQDIIAGVTVFGKIFQELPTDLGDCKGMQDDINRIEQWAPIFNDPQALVMKLVQNLQANFQGILSDITAIKADFADDDMYDAGKEVADVMVKALGPVPPANMYLYWDMDRH